jgi:hypothetical protein
MSKSLLEELLIQAGTLNEETEKRVNTNQKTIIESTMANAVKNFIQEAVEDETNVAPDGGGVMEMGDIYEEEDVDIETGETLEDEDEEIEIEDDEEDGEDEEIEIEDDEEDEEIEIEDDEDYEEDEEDEEIEIEDDDYGMDDEESFEDDKHMDDTTDFDDDEEVTDMTNASLEEVMDFIENSEDEVVIKIVKKPTYSVSVEHMDDDTEVEVSEDMLAEVISQELEEVEKMNEMNLSPVGPTKMKDESGKEYEVKAMSENRKLKKQLAQLKAENRKLKLNETKSVAALKSMMEQSKKLALVNSNLAYVSRLFTEHVTTKQEKVEILKAFDSAKTITESQKRFKILNESLSTRTQKKKLNVNIKESVNLNQQKVIKEEKAFVEDPTQANILRLMNYKSQL